MNDICGNHPDNAFVGACPYPVDKGESSKAAAAEIKNTL